MVYHVAGPGVDWCDGCSDDELAACSVLPTLEAALGEAFPGALVLVHEGVEVVVNDITIPTGVHVRAVGGPAAASIFIEKGASKGITLAPQAILEGFWISPQNVESVGPLEYLVKMDKGEGDDEEGEKD